MTDLLTKIENDSIRAFVHSAADEGYLRGRVLDYGCGKQPYRDIVEKQGGEYVPFDRAGFPGNVSAEDIGAVLPLDSDSVLCTQVVQYIPDVGVTLAGFRGMLRFSRGRRSGCLVLTYPTNWPEVEAEDLHRFTKAGMELLLIEAGFSILRHERRATVHGSYDGEYAGYEFALGYGVVARA